MRRAKIPREATTNGAAAASQTTSANSQTQANGTGTGTNTPTAGSQGAIVVSKEWSGGPDGLPDVRIPEQTVEVGVGFLKERIKDVVEVADGDD